MLIFGASHANLVKPDIGAGILKRPRACQRRGLIIPDRVLTPLPGIGTLSLTRSEYEGVLIPIAPPEVPKPAPPRQPEPPTTVTKSLNEVVVREGLETSTLALPTPGLAHCALRF
jgi:hypothetical protein